MVFGMLSKTIIYLLLFMVNIKSNIGGNHEPILQKTHFLTITLFISDPRLSARYFLKLKRIS